VAAALLTTSASLLTAQSATTPARSSADAALVDSTPRPISVPKKKGGLFGKMKGLAQNKVVRAVAKTAACTMIPGGQMVAGAIDGASTKDAAKNVAKGAAVSAMVGGGAGGSSCMPGLMGNAGAAMAGAVPGASLPGMPTTGLAGAGMSAVQMRQMMDQYRKMGMDPAQLQAMQQMVAGQMKVEQPDSGK
jgi:hypothetical protein